MQRFKSKRHVRAANARWQRAQAERDAGIPDRPAPTDCRDEIPLDLRSAGGQLWLLRPCPGKIAWDAIDEHGRPQRRAALKSLLRSLADDLPRQLGARNFL
jgi:hypothetical protein